MSNNPSHTKEWAALKKHAQTLRKNHLNQLFEQDKERFNTLSASFDGLFFDYSKQRVTSQTINKLCDLLVIQNFEQKRAAMFEGERINLTEDRAVMHTALRRPKGDSVLVDGKNIMPEIHNTLEKMEKFSKSVRAGHYTGATGKKFEHVVSIGIGGSDLGPRLVSRALKTNANTVKTSFVTNIDSDDILYTLNQCNPETTLFVVISKSFKTQETIVNAKTAVDWLQASLPKGSDYSKHFIAVSSNINAVQEFGISSENIFPMWDWVNGRFSLWSAVGLPICLQHGFEEFKALLNGAYAMDKHFLNAPIAQNIPVLMALIGIWNRNFLEHRTLAVLPYAEKLLHFPAYLQQLEMESNGKMIDLDNQQITDYVTNPILFGEVGTNGQHSFYQLFHQGSHIIPCDFIGIIEDEDPSQERHKILLSNMMAQAQAFMQGRSIPNEPYRYFEGNRPSSTLLLNKIDAYHLGMLIALYEHKCFTQGVVWNINSFDQFGVELGKELSLKLQNGDLTGADNSTKGLYSRIHKTTE